MEWLFLEVHDALVQLEGVAGARAEALPGNIVFQRLPHRLLAEERVLVAVRCAAEDGPQRGGDPATICVSVNHMQACRGRSPAVRAGTDFAQRLGWAFWRQAEHAHQQTMQLQPIYAHRAHAWHATQSRLLTTA